MPCNFVIFQSKVVFKALFSFTRKLHILKKVSPIKFIRKNLSTCQLKIEWSELVLSLLPAGSSTPFWLTEKGMHQIRRNNFRFPKRLWSNSGICFTFCIFFYQKPFVMISEVKLGISFKEVNSIKHIITISNTSILV